MNSVRFCDGLQQDECGTWYCPYNPEIAEPDCKTCMADRDQAVDRAVERKWEEGSSRWGE